MHMTVEAIYEAGVLKPLTPLEALSEHTKVRLTIEAVPPRAVGPSVVELQRQQRIVLPPEVARVIGDGHEYDLV